MRVRFAFVLLAALLTGGIALSTARAAEEEQEPSRARLGQKIPNLTFTLPEGKQLSLYDFKDKKVIVLVFLSFDCPISTSYSQPLADIGNEFGPHGLTLLGLTTNEEQTPAEVAKLGKHYRLPFPVVLDKGLKAANALQANVTPEVFVLDGRFVLRYRGRIDNAYYARLKRNPEVTAHDLHQVIGELLSGRSVSNPATTAIGCFIPRDLDRTARDGEVTYYRDVLPILQNRCQSCHRPGEVGPFSLLTYRQAVNWADDIKTFTQNRFMPPWKPQEGGPFHSERKLPQEEIDLLARWVDSGTPQGNPRDAAPKKDFPEGWQLGQPDLVLEMPGEFQVGPSGHDVFRCFVLPTNIPQDVYVAAVEVRPGNSRIVHHALLFVDTKGQGRKLEKKAQDEAGEPQNTAHPALLNELDKGPGYSVKMGVGFVPQGGMSGWAPGAQPRELPDGYGYFLPARADVILQIHYHRNGRLESDRTRVGLYFVKKEKGRQLQNAIMAGGSGLTGVLRPYFAIPAGEKRYQLTDTLWAKEDCRLFAITPHMHLLGKEVKVTLTQPDGSKRTLLHIKDWDYNWQETYMFKTPVTILKGARLDMEAYFDNSAGNPLNPNKPPRRVTYGEQTTNEMCFVFLGGASERPGRRLPLTPFRPRTAEEQNAK